MLENLAQDITFQFLKRKIIDHDEIDIFIYGVEAILTSFITVTSILVIGFMLKKLSITITFIIVFAWLRRYTGGYHAKTFFQCYFMSIGLYLISIYISSILLEEYLFLINIVIYTISFIILIKLCPIENENNPLTNKELKENSKKIKVSLVITGVFILLALISDTFESIVKITSVSLLMVSFTALIEKLKRGDKYVNG